MPDAIATAMKNTTKKAPAAMSPAKAAGALEAVTNRLSRSQSMIKNAKENAAKTGKAVLGVVELQGTAFLASMAEGYWGEDKMKVGGVDVRAGAGAAGVVWGIVDTLQGNDGSHQLMIGNGLLVSAVVGAGRRAGHKLAEKKVEGAAAPGQPAPGAVQPAADAGAPAAVKLGGPLREIDLGGAPDLAGRSRTSNRMIPVEVLDRA